MKLNHVVRRWTPPHFWSLALYREQEYAKLGIPMLPVTHGSKFTRQCILFHTILLAAVAVLPFVTAMSGLLYLTGALALNAEFIAYARKLYRIVINEALQSTFH
ncbi:MAG: UbiA family prenyltransferase [Betaproteobacteria bacterium]|nr:UbiA family prenyltransferase [Betaproteobacteria bacterium]